MNRSFYAVSGLLAGCGLTLAFWTALDHALMQTLFLRGSFYVMLLLVAAWAWTVKEMIRSEKPDFHAFLRAEGAGLLLALGLAGIVFISVTPHFRILDDETSLLAVSKSMLAERSVANVTQGKWYFNNFNEGDFNFPKRPFLFPFLTFVLHVLLGYHPANPFILNFGVLAGLFFLTYWMLKRYFGKAAGIAGIFAMAAPPVIAQTATSAGFDLFSAFLLFASLAALAVYFEKPGPERFAFVWATLLLLANARYEGPLYFGLAIVYLALRGGLRLEYLKASCLYALTPLLFLPTFWQRGLIETDLQAPEGIVPFTAGHLVEHTVDFLKSLGDFRFEMPYATIIEILGVLGLIVLAAGFMTGRWPQNKKLRPFIGVAVLLSGAYWAVVNAHWGAFLSLPDGTRLMAYMAVALSYLAVVFLARMPFFKARPLVLVAVFLALFGLYHRISVENKQQNLLNRTREYRTVLEFLKKQFPQNMLVVSNLPQLYPVQNYGAMNFDSANLNRNLILTEMRNGLYQHTFVVQEIDYETGQPTPETALDEGFELETVFETQRETQHMLRISRVIP